ncbi:MAG: hypothetical protein AB1374_08575 [Bacillota bacterium]
MYYPFADVCPIPALKPNFITLMTDRELAPGEQLTFGEYKSTTLVVAFRVQSTGRSLLTIEELKDGEWTVADNSACYEGTILWQCLLKNQVFRVRFKNTSEKPITVTAEMNLFEPLPKE